MHPLSSHFGHSRKRAGTAPVVDEAGGAGSSIVVLQACFDLASHRVQLGQPGVAVGQQMKRDRLEQAEAAHALRLRLRELKRHHDAYSVWPFGSVMSPSVTMGGGAAAATDASASAARNVLRFI